MKDFYLCDPITGVPYNGETFDWNRWLKREAGYPILPLASRDYPELDRLGDLVDLRNSSEGRRLLTEHDPLLFALEYLPDDISIEGEFTFSDMQLDAFREAHTWRYSVKQVRKMKQQEAALSGNAIVPWRNQCWVGPRESGKSHLFHKVLPLWGAAHGYIKFACFADNTHGAALKHMVWWIDKNEGQLYTNQLLMQDFPGLCKQVKGKRFSIQSANGFTAMAQSISGDWRGIIKGYQRPDYVVMDDIDATQQGTVDGRIREITGKMQYLGKNSRIFIMGTTTTYDNVVHQALMHLPEFDGPGARKKWTRRWTTRYYPPIVKEADGRERSFWPLGMPLGPASDPDSLLWMRENDSLWLNEMENRPTTGEGAIWAMDLYQELPELWEPVQTILFIDAAHKAGKHNDETALTVVSANADAVARRKDASGLVTGKVAVHYAKGFRFKHSNALNIKVKELMVLYPDISKVIVETNGGDWPLEVLEDLPTGRPKPVNQTKPKAKRIGDSHTQYARGNVYHDGSLHELVNQQLKFGGEQELTHDDVVDVVATGILYWLNPESINIKPYNNRVYSRQGGFSRAGARR